MIEKIFSLNFDEIQLNVEIKLEETNIYLPALGAGHLVVRFLVQRPRGRGFPSFTSNLL